MSGFFVLVFGFFRNFFSFFFFWCMCFGEDFLLIFPFLLRFNLFLSPSALNHVGWPGLLLPQRRAELYPSWKNERGNLDPCNLLLFVLPYTPFLVMPSLPLIEFLRGWMWGKIDSQKTAGEFSFRYRPLMNDLILTCSKNSLLSSDSHE